MASKKKCLIYANCQGQGISRFLLCHTEYADTYENTHLSNFYFIENKKSLPIDVLQQADCFIYQPLGHQYGVYSSEKVMGRLKPGCVTISFPYIYNDALWPFAPSGNSLKGGEILIRLMDRGYSIHRIIDAFLDLAIDCEFDRRLDRTLSILKEKEKKTDIKVSDFIREQLRKKRLFLIQSHPTSVVYIHCVNQILKCLGYDDVNPSLPFSIDDVELDPCWPITPYEFNHYQFEFIDGPDSNWQSFYSEKIEDFLRTRMKDRATSHGGSKND